MKTAHALITLLTALLLGLFLAPLSRAAEKRIAIIGDSIPYGGQWPTLIESALRQQKSLENAEIVNFALPSETASGLSEQGHAGGAFPRPCIHDRLGRILKAYKPDFVIGGYGMNDGIYQPLDKERFDAYKKGMTRLKNDIEKAGAKFIIITPPPFQADNKAKAPGNYDEVLDAYSNWLVSQEKQGWNVIDIRPAVKKSIEAKKAENPNFTYAGDGIHPGAEGHRFIAEAIWPQLAKKMGFPGKVTFPQGQDFDKAFQKQQTYKHAWLSETKYERPGIPAGISIHALKYLKDGVSADLWNGFTKLSFKVDGRNALLVLPAKKLKGSPWIWRTEFFGAFPQADIALLKQGFCVAYIDMQNMYGSPKSLEIMDQFYQFIIREYGLSPKPVVEGFSRGGLFAFNWAIKNPKKVAALYVDAPVCDFKSWPGGKGKGKGSPDDWNRLQQVYGFTEQQALDYKLNPIDNLASLAKARVPVIAVVGNADDVVPVEENTAIVEQRYKKLGGKITVIHKPGIGHHPHSLPDPAPIVEFVMKATGHKPVPVQ